MKKEQKIVAGLHMLKTSHDGYCTGKCYEHPEILVSGKTDVELSENFIKCAKAYLKRHPHSNSGNKEVIKFGEFN